MSYTSEYCKINKLTVISISVYVEAGDMPNTNLKPMATCDMRPNTRLATTDPLYQGIHGTVIFSQTVNMIHT